MPGYVLVTPQPGMATLADLKWERMAAQQSVDALTTTRTAGEKWATAITSLTTVFSLIVLIKGPEDISKVSGTVGRWLPEKVADETWIAVMIVATIVFGVLAIVSAINRGPWVGGGFGVVGVVSFALLFITREKGFYLVGGGWWLIVFLLAALALVAGGFWPRGLNRWLRFFLWTLALVCVALGLLAAFQDVALWETVVIVGLGAAVLFACVSILTGARAAYGPVYSRLAASGGLLRTQQRHEVGRSRTYLLLSIYSAVVAVACIAGAIAVTWITTPDKPAPGNMLLLRKTEPPLCGELLFKDDDELVIQTSAKTKPHPVLWDDVRALTVVAACTKAE